MSNMNEKTLNKREVESMNKSIEDLNEITSDPDPSEKPIGVKSSTIKSDEINENKPIDMSSVIKLLIGISIAMLIVIGFVKIICNKNDCFFEKSQNILLQFAERNAQTFGQKIYFSFINALIFMIIIVIMTFILFSIFYFKFYKCLYCLIILSTLGLTLFITQLIINEVFKHYNFAIDLITIGLFLWNYTILGEI